MSYDQEKALTRFEKIPTHVFPTSGECSEAAAREIADLIRARQAEGKRCVLGLATGSTPMTLYAELVRMHQRRRPELRQRGDVQPRRVLPHAAAELQSYRRFMGEHLFDHVDIDPANIHIPDGTVEPEQVPDVLPPLRADDRRGRRDRPSAPRHRADRAHRLQRAGQPADSRTRLIWLDQLTRNDAAADFFGEANVPRRAITMGVGTILEARRVLLLAFGEGKAPIVAQAVEGPVTRNRRRQLPPGASAAHDHARQRRGRAPDPLPQPVGARRPSTGTSGPSARR